MSTPIPDASLCPQGCYWTCEHRAPLADSVVLPLGTPMPVHDEEGRPLRRCRECGGSYYSAEAHTGEHGRMRTLGLLPERYPTQWPVVIPRRDGQNVS